MVIKGTLGVYHLRKKKPLETPLRNGKVSLKKEACLSKEIANSFLLIGDWNGIYNISLIKNGKKDKFCDPCQFLNEIYGVFLANGKHPYVTLRMGALPPSYPSLNFDRFRKMAA